MPASAFIMLLCVVNKFCVLFIVIYMISVKRDFAHSALCWDALAKRCWKNKQPGAARDEIKDSD